MWQPYLRLEQEQIPFALLEQALQNIRMRK